jgi:hypothetical protein
MEKDVWFLKFLIIHRVLLNKKIYMELFCQKNRLWHMPEQLSILFISVGHGSSKAGFKELLVIRGRT